MGRASPSALVAPASDRSLLFSCISPNYWQILHAVPVTESPARDQDLLVHEFKNHVSVIVGFCDLLLREMPEGDLNRASILEIQRAALVLVELLPRIPRQEPSADV